MNRAVDFKGFIDIYQKNIQEIKNKFKDYYFYFDDDITNFKKNKKLGKHK